MTTPPAAETVLSGILVCCLPAELGQVADDVAGLGWAEVHDVDPVGRMVVTTEADDIHQGMDRLQQLKALPRVLAAELAEFRFVDPTC